MRRWMVLSSIVFLSVVLGVIPVSGIPPGPPDYTFHTIDVPGALKTQAAGINDRLEIVGWYEGPPDPNTLPILPIHGFLLEGDPDRPIVRPIDFPGALQTKALGLDDTGDVVGVYQDAKGKFHGFLFEGGNNFTTIDGPGTTTFATSARELDERGNVIGLYRDGIFPFTHAFVRAPDGTTITFDYPGATPPPTTFAAPGATTPTAGVTLETAGRGINDPGDKVGFYKDVTLGGIKTHAFLLDKKGTFSTFDVPGASKTVARDINNSGHIVGFYRDRNAPFTHGFLLARDILTTIDVPDSSGRPMRTVASAINEHGEVVGLYIDALKKVHGFLATPNH